MSAIDYGIPDAGQRAELAPLLAHAFAMSPEAETTWMTAAGADNLRVVHDQRDVLGGLALIPMGQFFGGASVPILGVAGVGVRPDRLRRGVASTLMRRALQEARERGVAAAALYASTWALYRGVGFECAGTRHLATLSPALVPVLEHGLPVRQATPDDRPAVEALYRELAPAYDGHLDRGGYIWPRLYDLRFGVPAHGLLVHDDDGLAGYVYYRKHPPVAGNFRHRVEICDLLARSPAAWRRLWTVIADMGTMVETVELPSAPHDPLFLHHPEPRFRMTLLENFFARITDVVAFLGGRGYAPGVQGRVELLLHDDVLTEQAGAWCLEVQDGHGHVTRGGKGTVRLDARGLASWATGFVPLSTLAQLGRAEGPAAALRLADGLTAGPTPWMREMF